MFTEQEQAYLRNNQLARLATVDTDDQPDVVPVRYEFDGQHFYVGGQFVTQSRKYKNVAAGSAKVALVIDDFIPVESGMPGIRGIRIYGTAETVMHEGWQGLAPHLKITPTTTWSWGIEEPAFNERGFVTRKTVWEGVRS
jgi:pyridoxamine 5'-phosphate oxidase family protein